MIWLAAAALLALLAALAWWGSSIIFHPPKLLDNAVWPEQFGLPYERVSFRNEDGLLLRGWMIRSGRPTERSLLCCHGWGDNKGDLLERIHFLAREFNLFLFDSRAHGESEGSRSTIGCLEARDLEAALAFLKATRPDWAGRLGVFGLSMGAAMALRGMALHPELRCGAFESPFSSYEEVVRQFNRNNHRLPHFPILTLVLLAVRLRLGEDPEPYSPAYHVAAIRNPIFFIAAEQDTLMPPEQVRRLYEAALAPKSFWLAPEAKHGKCWEAAGEEYRRRLLEFFERHL